MSVKMALKMGQKIKIGKEDSSLNKEPAYCDGMHKRVKNFVTLTLWVFSPRDEKHANFGCNGNEDTANIELFFKTFNEAMGKYLGEPRYISDPFLLMMDEKRANFEAISRVFGENFSKTKAKTCQFHHFRNCAEKYKVDLSLEE